MLRRKLRIRSPTFTGIIEYIPPSFYDIIHFYELLEDKPSLAYEYLINKCILYEGEKWEIFWIKVIDTILQNSPVLTLESLMQKYDEITEKAQSNEIVARKLFMYKLAIMLNRDIEEVKNWSEEDFIYFSYLAFNGMNEYASEPQYTQQPAPQVQPRPISYEELLADAIQSANLALSSEIERLKKRGIKFAKTKKELNEMKNKVKKVANINFDEDWAHIQQFLNAEDRDRYRSVLLRKRAAALLKKKKSKQE